MSTHSIYAVDSPVTSQPDAHTQSTQRPCRSKKKSKNQLLLLLIPLAILGQ